MATATKTDMASKKTPRPGHPVIDLVQHVYHITMAYEGHLGDDVYLAGDPQFVEDARYKISNMLNGEELRLAYKTLPQMADYFRKLADAIDALDHGNAK